MEEELQFTMSPRWDGDAETEKILVIWWLNMFSMSSKKATLAILVQTNNVSKDMTCFWLSDGCNPNS